MAEAMSNARREQRATWLLRRLEDHLIHVERLGRHARELGLDRSAEVLGRHAEDLDSLIDEMAGEDER